MSENPSPALSKIGRALVKMARGGDRSTLAELILRDEETGDRVVNGRIHDDWHDFVKDKRRCVIWASVESGKSQQITIAETLGQLGDDPSMRVLVISETKAQAEKFTRPLMHYIGNSRELRAIYPRLRPGRPWVAGRFNISDKRGEAKDFSVEATGMDGSILGARYDWVIIDDLLSLGNIRTSYQRDKVFEWLTAILLGRLTRRAKVIFLANAWHREDAAHRLVQKWGWDGMRSPVDVRYPDGELPWEERWPASRLALARKEWPEYDRLVRCIPRRTGEQRCDEEWIQKSLKRGSGRYLLKAMSKLPPGCNTFTFVDIGVGKKERNDRTSICTVMSYSNGDHELIGLQAGRWRGPVILQKAFRQGQALKSTSVFVENNAAQEFLVQFGQILSPGIRVEGFHTGMNKWDETYGIESIFVEMFQGKWIFPSGEGELDPEVEGLLGELRDYDPEKHTGDRFMSLWGAREALREGAFVHRISSAMDAAEYKRMIEEDRRLAVEEAKAEGRDFRGEEASEMMWDELRGHIGIESDDEDGPFM